MTTESKTSCFLKLRQQLHATASRILFSKEDADDALQELFIKMWQHADDNAHSAQKQAFLYTALRNICIDILRKRKLNADATEYSRHMDDNMEVPLDRVDNQDKLTNIHYNARRLLSGIQLKVFRLYTLEELSYQEISELLGITVEATRNHMCRARKILREKCKELLNDE
ncbi:MAG: sigma-70 family RNA polymerase sigma factor [Duncaniella sp.]|nr:sigma-70 family RNA polymerase sigma factor [Duncaniella sp.]